MKINLIETVDRDSSPGLTEFMQQVLVNPAEIRRLEISLDFSSYDFFDKAVINDNIFLQSKETAPPSYINAPFFSRGIEVVALPEAILLARSLVVIAAGGYVYQGSIDWSIPPHDRLVSIASFDTTFLIDSQGCVNFNAAEPFETSEKIAIPICGPGFPNFGHFLYDGLALAVAIRCNTAFTDKMVFVGPKLKEWQQDILRRLNILDYYFEVVVNTKFLSILPSTMLYGHLPFPSRFLRVPFDLLRMQVSTDRLEAGIKVFLSRGDDKKRMIINRKQLEQVAYEKGFKIVDPSKLDLKTIIRLLSNCQMVMGESGAGLANIGFCNFGTKIIEIQASSFPDQYTRATCAVFGLHWHAYIIEDSTPEKKTSVGAESSDICSEIDLTRFMSVLDSIMVTI